MEVRVNESVIPVRSQPVFMVFDPKSRRAGVRAPLVALKPGNAGGAKGCRKVDTQ
jgi:hypothetical protein